MDADRFWAGKRVLAFAREAGGADVMAPAVVKLHAMGADCLVTAASHACDKFVQYGLPYTALEPYSAEKADAICLTRWQQMPALVFTSATSLPIVDMTERFLWNWAAARHV